MFDDFDIQIQSDEFAREYHDYQLYCLLQEEQYEDPYDELPAQDHHDDFPWRY